MRNYKLSKDMLEVFKKENWWTFVGKYFGFPDCCIKYFCEKKSYDIEKSLFIGTGYVPCPCCNKKIINQEVVQQYTEEINSQRWHTEHFGVSDELEDNPKFFEIMEDFYHMIA